MNWNFSTLLSQYFIKCSCYSFLHFWITLKHKTYITKPLFVVVCSKWYTFTSTTTSTRPNKFLVYRISQWTEISLRSFLVHSSQTTSFWHIKVSNVQQLPHTEHNDYKLTYTPAVTSSINIPANSKQIPIYWGVYCFHSTHLMCWTMKSWFTWGDFKCKNTLIYKKMHICWLTCALLLLRHVLANNNNNSHPQVNSWQKGEFHTTTYNMYYSYCA
jgi:hypothetical protein